MCPFALYHKHTGLHQPELFLRPLSCKWHFKRAPLTDTPTDTPTDSPTKPQSYTNGARSAKQILYASFCSNNNATSAHAASASWHTGTSLSACSQSSSPMNSWSISAARSLSAASKVSLNSENTLLHCACTALIASSLITSASAWSSFTAHNAFRTSSNALGACFVLIAFSLSIPSLRSDS